MEDNYDEITDSMIEVERETNRPYTNIEEWERKRREGARHFDEAASQFEEKVSKKKTA